MQISLEQQVDQGNAALGQLVRQFFAVNDFKHIQFMGMAHTVTGERWLHSSQISSLKRGGTKHLTGFPLYSLAKVNQRIWEIGEGIAKAPPGTKADDWKDKMPMMNDAEGRPLDVGDFWRIYFGEMPAPLYTNQNMEIDDSLAKEICKKVTELFIRKAQEHEQTPMDFAKELIHYFPVSEPDILRKVTGVLLGVIDLKGEEMTESIDDYTEMLSEGLGENIKVRDMI